MPNFRVGQKVVCIAVLAGSNNEICPIKNCVYTIRHIVDYPGDQPGLRFVEIVNEPRTYTDGFLEVTFACNRFRPLADKPADISVFTKILDDVNNKAPVDA